MLTVTIYYTGNQKGLVGLLVGLQPQLHPDDDIYIIDTTKDRSGVKLATMYGSTRCYIFVEVGDYSREKARDFGMQSASENKQEFVLFISDRCVVSTTFIANLKKAFTWHTTMFAPKIVATPYDRLDGNFKWYNPVTLEEHLTLDETNQTECFALRLDDIKSNKSIIFNNELVCLLPS